MSDEKIVYTPSETTHWRNLFKKKCQTMGAHNLNPGEEIVAIFDKMPEIGEIKDHNGNKKEVVVATFENNLPEMVLNITNCRIIESLYGGLRQDWVGKAIQIYAGSVKNPAGPGTVTGLKIRPKKPDIGEDVKKYEKALKAAKTLDELKRSYLGVPKHLRTRIEKIKDDMKGKLS